MTSVALARRQPPILSRDSAFVVEVRRSFVLTQFDDGLATWE
jgi:hypothetical protein